MPRSSDRQVSRYMLSPQPRNGRHALGRPAGKLNVGQLGNITPQLHVHVIARRPDDAAWPAPVWGFGVAEAYAPAAQAAAEAAARRALGL